MGRHQLAWDRSRPARLLLLVLLVLLLAMVAASGDEHTHAWPNSYRVGNAHRGHPGMALRGESFTVYSRPMATKYAEVYNARQAPIPLPPEIVERFRDRVIGASCVCVWRGGGALAAAAARCFWLPACRLET